MRSGRSDIVLLVMPDTQIGEVNARLIDRITDALELHGYVGVYRRRREGRSVATMAAALAPAAVVNLAAYGDDEMTLLESLGVPVVRTTIAGPGQRFGTPQERFGRTQAEYLALKGHRVLGYGRPLNPRLIAFVEPRLEGVRQWCAEHGLAEPVVAEHGLDVESAAGAVGAWRGAGVTAVAAYNDEYALAILAGMRSLGLTAPADLAVIGIDNITVGQFAAPPLTSVDVEADAIADGTVHAILEALGVEKTAEPKAGAPSPARVVERESA